MPQRDHADVVISFFPGVSFNLEQDGDAHLNVRLTLHGTLHHPDLSEFFAEDRSGCVRSTLARERGRAVEHLEIDGSQTRDSQHSHPLALTQLLLV